ncbi:MAG TPA: hypothetical protein VFL96_08755 [Acidobacteriaceae bacterium]|nr:hypothetical protein [Acidobacteriaceae bacterium]
MKEPVDHIERPRLPWRDSGTVTECGYDASMVRTLTREEFFQRQKDLGKQRTAMLTCMTCSQTAERWGSWEDDPRMALQREIEWERRGRWARDNRGERLKDELLAVAALIDARREEFDAHVSAIEQRREWLKKKEALNRRPKPQRLPPL